MVGFEYGVLFGLAELGYAYAEHRGAHDGNHGQ